MLLKVRKPTLDFPLEWSNILKQLNQMKPRLRGIPVLWELPESNWVKYNSDGVSNGNGGSSSWDFCLSDTHGELMHAEGSVMENTNNIETEVMAILQAVMHYNKSR